MTSAEGLARLEQVARIAADSPGARDRLIRQLAGAGIPRAELARRTGLTVRRIAQVIGGTR